jgi:hypothetical protein
MAMAALVARGIPGAHGAMRAFHAVLRPRLAWPNPCEVRKSMRRCVRETRRTHKAGTMGTMIRRIASLPGAAVHYSLGTMVVVTHLVVVAIQDAKSELRY